VKRWHHHSAYVCTPTLARSDRSGSGRGRSVAGHARLRGRIPVKRGPCSTLRRALPLKGGGNLLSRIRVREALKTWRPE